MKKVLETVRPFEKYQTWFVEYKNKIYDLNNLPNNFVFEANLNLSGLDLQELPDLSRVVVLGDFDCSDNELLSLQGAPHLFVGGSFNCSANLLYSLSGAPKYVCGNFDCSENMLQNLEGRAKKNKWQFLVLF